MEKKNEKSCKIILMDEFAEITRFYMLISLSGIY